MVLSTSIPIINLPVVSFEQEPLKLNEDSHCIWRAKLHLKIEHSQEIKDQEDLDNTAALIDSIVGEYIGKVPKDRKGYLTPCLKKVPLQFQLAYEHVTDSMLPNIHEGDITTTVSIDITIFFGYEQEIINIFDMETKLDVDLQNGEPAIQTVCHNGNLRFAYGKKPQ